MISIVTIVGLLVLKIILPMYDEGKFISQSGGLIDTDEQLVLSIVVTDRIGHDQIDMNCLFM